MTRDDFARPAICQNLVGPVLGRPRRDRECRRARRDAAPWRGAQLPGPTLIQQSTKPDAQQSAGPPAPADRPDSFIELHQALTAARERLEELSKAAEAVAATRQLQQELAALRQENQQLRAEIEAVQAERGELETAKQAAEARAAELTKTVEQATAQAREMDQELLAVAARWQNAQLNANRAPTRSSGDQMDADARPMQTALQSQIEKPDGGAEQTSVETARLREQMEASEQRVAAADSARAEAEAQLSEMRASLQRAEQEKASIGADLARVKGELASAREQVGRGQEPARMVSRPRPWRPSATSCVPAWRPPTRGSSRSEAANAQLEMRGRRRCARRQARPLTSRPRGSDGRRRRCPSRGKALTWINGAILGGDLLFSRLPICLGRSGSTCRASSPISIAIWTNGA